MSEAKVKTNAKPSEATRGFKATGFGTVFDKLVANAL
jgi:hypothetical protein